MDTHAGSELYFGNCVNCCQAVHGVGRAFQAMGKLFHDTCFTCSICCKQLSGKPFYSMSGKIFCEDDFLYSGVHPPEICKACGHLVNDMVLQARGKSYHPACFCCVICRGNLEGLPFTVGSDDKIYCLKDYHRLQAPRCTACGMPIVPSEGSTESSRVVSLNRSYHVECYDTMMNLT